MQGFNLKKKKKKKQWLYISIQQFFLPRALYLNGITYPNCCKLYISNYQIYSFSPFKTIFDTPQLAGKHSRSDNNGKGTIYNNHNNNNVSLIS